MVEKESDEFHLVNMIIAGRLPFTRKMSEIDKKNLIQKSKLGWNIVNEERCPIMCARIEKDEENMFKKKKAASINLWFTGAFNISGLTKDKEATDLYGRLINELNKYCKGIIK